MPINVRDIDQHPCYGMTFRISQSTIGYDTSPISPDEGYPKDHATPITYWDVRRVAVFQPQHTLIAGSLRMINVFRQTCEYKLSKSTWTLMQKPCGSTVRDHSDLKFCYRVSNCSCGEFSWARVLSHPNPFFQTTPQTMFQHCAKDKIQTGDEFSIGTFQ